MTGATTSLAILTNEAGAVSVGMILQDWTPGQTTVGLNLAVASREAAILLISALTPFVSDLEDAYIAFAKDGDQQPLRNVLALATTRPVGKA